MTTITVLMSRSDLDYLHRCYGCWRWFMLAGGAACQLYLRYKRPEMERPFKVNLIVLLCCILFTFGSSCWRSNVVFIFACYLPENSYARSRSSLYEITFYTFSWNCIGWWLFSLCLRIRVIYITCDMIF